MMTYGSTITGRLTHKATAAVEWTEAEVRALRARYPHLTDMEVARRSGWTVFAVTALEP